MHAQVDGSAADWEEVLLRVYPVLSSKQRAVTADLAFRVRLWPHIFLPIHDVPSPGPVPLPSRCSLAPLEPCRFPVVGNTTAHVQPPPPPPLPPGAPPSLAVAIAI